MGQKCPKRTEVVYDEKENGGRVMKKFSTYLVVMFMIVFWILRIVITLASELGKDFMGVTPINKTFEIAILKYLYLYLYNFNCYFYELLLFIILYLIN